MAAPRRHLWPDRRRRLTGPPGSRAVCERGSTVAIYPPVLIHHRLCLDPGDDPVGDQMGPHRSADRAEDPPRADPASRRAGRVRWVHRVRAGQFDPEDWMVAILLAGSLLLVVGIVDDASGLPA